MTVSHALRGRGASRSYALISIGLVACSMLMYEILLTRISALRFMFHFAFLVISNCLLGMGAGGTLIFIFQDRMRERERGWIWLLSLLYVAALLGAYAFLVCFRIPEDLLFTRFPDMVRFTAYNLVAATPFLFGGGVIGWILTANAERVNRFYFSDLLGAGIGCWLCPLLLWRFGAGGCFVFLTLLALFAIAVSVPWTHRKPTWCACLALGVAGLWLMPRLDRLIPVPGKDLLNLTHMARADLRGPSEYTQWSATGRIDLLPVAPRDRFIFGRGDRTLGWRLPDQRFILQDGSAGTFIQDFSGEPETLRVIGASTYSSAVRLRRNARVLVVGAGGGNDIWAAKLHGARHVLAVELNRPILEIHRKILSRFSRRLLDDPSIEWVNAEGRSVLMRETGTYDVIQMTGVDTWTALTSGAYVLAENYLYTREAFEAMYRRLAPEGIIQIIRFAADMEALRTISNVDAAFREMGVTDLEHSVVCLRTSDRLMALLIRKGPFTEEELVEVSRFAGESGIQIAYLPNLRTDSLLDTFIRSTEKAAFIRDFPRDISPTTDDRPYFFNFSKWRNPFAAAAHITEPTSISQGNPLFILGQLAVSIVLAACLVILPLSWSRAGRGDPTGRGRILLYFSCLGMGFIALEIGLIQKLTLFLGHPIYSITVTLCSMLVFTGLGSLLSGRWFDRLEARVWLVPALLTVLVTAFLTVSPALVSRSIAQPLPVRVAVATALLGPIGFVVGIPFAYGIRLLNRSNPTLIPWVWAVNACLTVIGSILTVILSMNFGFRVVLEFAVVMYWIGFAVLPSRT